MSQAKSMKVLAESGVDKLKGARNHIVKESSPKSRRKEVNKNSKRRKRISARSS